MVDLRACLRRAGLTAEEKECLSRSVLDGNPPDGMTRQHWYYVTGKARKKLRLARMDLAGRWPGKAGPGKARLGRARA